MRVVAADGAELSVPSSHAAREVDAPRFETGNIPGVRVSAARAWVDGAARVLVGCVRAPDPTFFDGAEQLVFDRANQIVRAAVGDVREMSAGAIEHDAPRWSQRFSGEASERFSGKHTLSFVARSHEAVVCSLVCRGATSACDPIVSGATLEGELGEPPPPRAWIRAAFAAADHPRASLLGAALFAFAIVAVVLARRPRPRDRR